MTVGSVSNSSHGKVPAADLWSQSTGNWTATSPADPPGSSSNFNEFRRVSCSATAQCVAVGSIRDASGNLSGGFAEIWNGSSWTLMDTSHLTTALGTFYALNGVSCPTSTFCVAVGDKGRQGNNGRSAAAASWGVAP
jgi:hypothetical protein